MLTCSNNLFLPKYNNFTLNMTKWMIHWIFILLYKECYLPCFTTSTHLRPSQIHVKAIQSDLYHMPFFWTCHMMRLIHAGRLYATLYIASRHHIHISSQSKRAQAWLLKQNPISLWNVIKAAGSRICLACSETLRLHLLHFNVEAQPRDSTGYFDEWCETKYKGDKTNDQTKHHRARHLLWGALRAVEKKSLSD